MNLTADLVIIGLSIRTSPATAMQDIPALWKRFLDDGAGAGPIYAVYCDYESDSTGAYTMVLGGEASASAPVPAGRRRVRIPGGTYTLFHADGDPAEVVWKTWLHINTEWTGRDRRRYIADFEKYVSPTSVEIAIGTV